MRNYKWILGGIAYVILVFLMGIYKKDIHISFLGHQMIVAAFLYGIAGTLFFLWAMYEYMNSIVNDVKDIPIKNNILPYHKKVISDLEVLSIDLKLMGEYDIARTVELEVSKIKLKYKKIA